MRSTRQQIQLELALEPMGRGEAPNRRIEEAEGGMARPGGEGSAATPGFTGGLMEVIVARDNLKKALAQVKRNKGAPGVDGMTVAELTPYLKEHWPTATGAAGRDPEAGRGHACPRHPDGARPLYPAGGAAGAAEPMGRDVQSEQLWLSPGPLGASGGDTRATIYCRGPPLGGGDRPGEVFRPGQP